MKRLALILTLVLSQIGAPLWAVNPDEVLADPGLEARARDISAGLRCVVCRGENIDESNAGIARDLRILVRERLVAGDSDADVVNYVVDRYGEYVLMKPTTGGANMILWATGPVLFLIAAGLALAFLRRRATAGDAANKLSAEEQTRLDELMGD